MDPSYLGPGHDDWYGDGDGDGDGDGESHYGVEKIDSKIPIVLCKITTKRTTLAPITNVVQIQNKVIHSLVQPLATWESEESSQK